MSSNSNDRARRYPKTAKRNLTKGEIKAKDKLKARSQKNRTTQSKRYDHECEYLNNYDQVESDFENHSGLDMTCSIDTLALMSSMFRDIARFSGKSVSIDMLAEVEALLALVINITGCTTYKSVAAAIYLYFRKYFNTSLINEILEYVKTNLTFDTQNGLEDTVESTDWIEMMRNVRDNWTLVKGNKLFTHFSKLLGLIVTLQLCKASDLTFKFKEYIVCEPDVKILHGNAYDVFDAALQTVVFFVESLSICFEEKSLRPLLVNDRAAAEIDEEYATVVLWWDLVKNGNLMKVAGTSDAEFNRRLETLTTKLRNMVNTRTSFEKKILYDKFMRLLKIKNDYITMKISSGVREAPYVIELFGGSSQGKTTCGDQILDALLTSANLPTSKDYRASYNAADKFMSSWTTDKLVLTIDDMANDKSQFVEKPPTRVIIDACNNQPFYANMADLDSKGKVFVEPKIVLVNTNVKDLDARVYSNCPYSIQRRMHAVITVTAKKKFQYIVDGKSQGIDSSKVAKHYAETGENPTFDDIWVLTVEKAVQPSELHISAGYKPVEFRGNTLKEVPFRLVLQYLIEDYALHRVSQENILRRMQDRIGAVQLCPHPGCKHIAGYCDLHAHEKQFGEELFNAADKIKNMALNKVQTDLNATDKVCSAMLMLGARYFYSHWDWMKFIPAPWLNLPYVMNACLFLNANNVKSTYIFVTTFIWFVTLYTCFILYVNFIYSVPIVVLLALIVQKSLAYGVQSFFMYRLRSRNSVRPALAHFRDTHARHICLASSLISVLYAMSKFYKGWIQLQNQGSLEPKTLEDIQKRDSEVNVWTETVLRELPVEHATATTSSAQLRGLVAKNLVYGTVIAEDKKYMVNGLFITSNVFLIPKHYFVAETLDITFRKEKPDQNGGKFACRVSLSQSIHLPNTDICVCYSATGGSFRNLTKYFTNERLPLHEFSMLWRSKDGSMTEAQGMQYPTITGNGECAFAGYKYQSLSMHTFKGLCGATLVSNRRAIITGIHLGGNSGTTNGCSSFFTRTVLLDAIEELKKIEGVVATGSAEKFESQVLGVNIITKGGLHPKSPINYMPMDSQIEYYGPCIGMSTFTSNVIVTKISDIVTDVTGDPNIYGPPIERPQYIGWQSQLEGMSIPALPYEPNLLMTAIRDYKSTFVPIAASPLWRSAKPLTYTENINGIDGCKFIDPIKLDTAIGFPLNGKKRNFVTVTLHEDNTVTRVFDEEIMNEISRCEECYLRGERAYTIAKACKKDEVLSKPKCRIFFSNPIALTYLVRKYFLPIVRILQMNPLASECAVGINCHGPEWNELHDHIFAFGEDRLIGGDYGRYDQKLPSQLLLASIRILIDAARECNYTSEDLSVMAAMAGDIVFALIAFNGDLIGLTEGTHISGNSLTVILNGIAGSLSARCCFYEAYPPITFDTRLKFQDCVKFITYGDDNAGSVKQGIDGFTIQKFSHFLARYGQIYTMPDKDSELVDFLSPEDFEFLKRKSVYHDALGCSIGALCDKSCFKMLHCYIRDRNHPLTEEHACALNIDTALREWFNHGPEVYETRRGMMQEVAERANLTHLCTGLSASYSDRAEEWKSKYFEIPSSASSMSA